MLAHIQSNHVRLPMLIVLHTDAQRAGKLNAVT